MGGLPPKDPRYRNPVQPTILSRKPATRKGLGKTQSNQKRRRKNPDLYDRYMHLHNFMSKTCLAATSATVFYRAPENPKREIRTAAECRPKAIREARYFLFSLPASGRTLATYIFCQQLGPSRAEHVDSKKITPRLPSHDNGETMFPLLQAYVAIRLGLEDLRNE